MSRQFSVERTDGVRFVAVESGGEWTFEYGEGAAPLAPCGWEGCELLASDGGGLCAFHECMDDAPVARGTLTHLRGRRNVAPLTSLLSGEGAKDGGGWQVKRIVGPDRKREARQRALLDCMVNEGLSFAAVARKHRVTINAAKAVLWKFAPEVAQKRQAARRTMSPEKRERRRQMANASQNRRNQARRAENVARTNEWRARNREAYNAYMREYRARQRAGAV